METKGSQIGFGLGVRICSGLALLTTLEGVCTCWSHDQAGLIGAWRLLERPLLRVPSKAANNVASCVGLTLHSPLQFINCCWSGCACPVLLQVTTASAAATNFWWLRTEHALGKLTVRHMHQNEGVRVVSLTAWRDALINHACLWTCFIGRVWKTNRIKLISSFIFVGAAYVLLFSM